jgi:hypothetical protein
MMLDHICEPIQSRPATSSGSKQTLQGAGRAPLTIDAIGRAIEDERKLPDVTTQSTKRSEPATKERYAEEEDE